MASGSFVVLVEDGKIVEVKDNQGLPLVGSGEDEDFHTYLLTPGFIDLHTHGMGKNINIFLNGAGI